VSESVSHDFSVPYLEQHFAIRQTRGKAHHDRAMFLFAPG